MFPNECGKYNCILDIVRQTIITMASPNSSVGEYNDCKAIAPEPFCQIHIFIPARMSVQHENDRSRAFQIMKRWM